MTWFLNHTMSTTHEIYRSTAVVYVWRAAAYEEKLVEWFGGKESHLAIQ
jgi:hypothetical protein